MVLASLTADALALGAHWIYDTTKIDKQFGKITVLFPPHEGTYHPKKKMGDFTHYGDQSFHLLTHLATDDRGTFDVTDYCQNWQSYMTSYEGYKDQASKETLKNLESGRGPGTCGSLSTDLGGPARITPLIYYYRDDLDKMLVAVKDLTTLTHCGPGVLDGTLFLARSCHSILNGATPRVAIELALEQIVSSPELERRLRRCLEPTQINTRQQIKDFGQMYSINAALPGAVYTVLKNEDNLEEAFIETVMAGGDSAARGMVVGMLLGAYHGSDKIPSRWLEKINKYKKIMAALDKLP